METMSLLRPCFSPQNSWRSAEEQWREGCEWELGVGDYGFSED